MFLIDMFYYSAKYTTECEFNVEILVAGNRFDISLDVLCPMCT